jgi:uncharacterized protein YjbJ (UPF0337 family)
MPDYAGFAVEPARQAQSGAAVGRYLRQVARASYRSWAAALLEFDHADPCFAGAADITLEIFTMNHDRIDGNWKQVKGKLKEQWGKLTDDDLDVIAGKRDQLLGRIQERHGVAKEEAERQVQTFERRNPDFFFEKS